MGTSLYIKNDVLNTSVLTLINQNFTTKKGLNLEEFTNLINDSTAKCVPKISSKYLHNIFNSIEKSGDKKIDLSEITNYLKNVYNIDLKKEVNSNTTVKDLINKIDNNIENKQTIKQNTTKKVNKLNVKQEKSQNFFVWLLNQFKSTHMYNK